MVLRNASALEVTVKPDHSQQPTRMGSVSERLKSLEFFGLDFSIHGWFTVGGGSNEWIGYHDENT
jgi:hypothetical protein